MISDYGFLFYIFSTIAVLSAVMVVSVPNPVHSVLYLISSFVSVAGLLLMLELEFLALIFVVVYVGAIAVLFLFVVMMLNVKISEVARENLLRYLPVGAVLVVVFLMEVLVVVDRGLTVLSSDVQKFLFVPSHVNWWDGVNSLTTMETLGQIFYTHYVHLFLMSGVILLVAMVGAIVLSMQPREARRQQIYQQVGRRSAVVECTLTLYVLLAVAQAICWLVLNFFWLKLWFVVA
jgi:NADH-quinone oxidoreductase subunit J